APAAFGVVIAEPGPDLVPCTVRKVARTVPALIVVPTPIATAEMISIFPVTCHLLSSSTSDALGHPNTGKQRFRRPCVPPDRRSHRPAAAPVARKCRYIQGKA